MAHLKRTVVVAVGAMVALTACAPAGYDGTNPGPAEPVAVAAAEPTSTADPGATPEVTAEPTAAPTADPTADPTSAPIPSNVKLTQALKGKAVPKMGKVVTDEKGFLLYRFDKDTNDPAASNCVDKCAQVWPPALTDGNPQLDGVADEKVGTVTRQDGTRQITLDGWPLYRYIGDKKAGQWKGQGVGGTWFAVQPNGKKNLECLPTGTPKAVEPPSNADSGSSY
ncbi:hypothetical protein ABT336_07605 [Micromonospora sp. NPDC000207]|uniref:COG4315 family predicted lipoprotein n=1 Tax=Micromonospora sp. NPDC000207 TaxID=3154246 RepID=UPI00331EC15F